MCLFHHGHIYIIPNISTELCNYAFYVKIIFKVSIFPSRNTKNIRMVNNLHSDNNSRVIDFVYIDHYMDNDDDV